ncbi:MAG: hypothetical protein ACTSPI_15025, partial [Candidatus Heimdallarchaeaceae archaeon]
IGPVVTKGNYEGFNGMVVIGFTWVSVLLAIPLSIRLLYYIKQGLDENRERKNVHLILQSAIPLLIVALSLFIGMFITHIYVSSFGIQFLTMISFYLLAIIIGLILIIPLGYILIAPRLKDDHQYKLFNIGTFGFLFVCIAATFIWFIFDVIIGYFA